MFRAQQVISLAFAMGILAGGAAAAQAPVSQSSSSPAAAPVLTINARIVILDVVVTDKAGNLVPGLTKDDFTIYEDKTQQTIRSFERPEQHVLPPGVSINSTADLKKVPDAPVTLLVLDELNARFEDMSFARNSLGKYLNAQPATLTQPTALIAATNTKFQLLQDYTLNRQAVLTALKNHFPEYPWRLMQSGKSGPGAAERLAMSLGSLEQIAEAVSGHPGRKNVIWVGRGFPAINTQDSTDQETAVIEKAVQHVIDVMRDARITLTTIDPTVNTSAIVDIETPEDLDMAEGANGADPMAGDVNFQLLAPATGGRVYLSRNDVDSEIGTSIRDGNNYYTLSYTPTSGNDAAQPYRRIRIKMSRPGLTATTRNGYYIQSTAPAPNSAPAALKQNLDRIAFDLGGAANSQLVYTGLQVTAHRLEDPPNTFAVDVDAKDLSVQRQPEGDSQAEITLMIASFNRQNKMIAHQIQETTARIKSDETSAQRAEFRIQTSIPVEAARVRVVARDAASGKMGTADLNPAAFSAK
ncbi:MAG: VWA domain-containing protein [Acidobacteriaceae bacterium]